MFPLAVPTKTFPSLIDGAVVTGSVRNLALCAALRAGCVEHFTLGLVGVLASVTASLAALRFVFKALGCVEFLFTGGENEFATSLKKIFLPLNGFTPSPC